MSVADNDSGGAAKAPSTPSAAGTPEGFVTRQIIGASKPVPDRVAVTPFSDSSGKPLVVPITNQSSREATPGMVVLPFSDANGNPLVVPVSKEPLRVTPFSGPDGQPLVAPPLVPGQKLEYPIPPTSS